MRYLIQNPFVLYPLKCVDQWIRKAKTTPIVSFKKILLCNTAHLGDAIIASHVINAIKTQYPNAKVGFLLSKEAKTLIQADYLHTIEHYKHSRSKKPLYQKFYSYQRQKKRLIQEINQIEYDIALDLYLYYGNSSHILHSMNIPIKLGYTSGGLGNFYTHSYHFEDKQQHMVDYYRPMLAKLGILDPQFQPSINVKPALLPLPEKYIVLHPGVGDKRKLWPQEKWQELYNELKSQYNVVFTGKGSEEERLIASIMQGDTQPVNLCNRVSVTQLAGVIENASLLIAGDTAVIHIAAALKRPFICLMLDPTNITLWRGYSDSGKVITPNEINSHDKKNTQIHRNKSAYIYSILNAMQSLGL